MDKVLDLQLVPAATQDNSSSVSECFSQESAGYAQGGGNVSYKPEFNGLFLVCLFYNQFSIGHCRSKAAPSVDHSLSATSSLCP